MYIMKIFNFFEILFHTSQPSFSIANYYKCAYCACQSRRCHRRNHMVTVTLMPAPSTQPSSGSGGSRAGMKLGVWGLLFGVDMQMRLSRSWFSAWTLRCLCQRCCCCCCYRSLICTACPVRATLWFFMNAVVNRKWATRGCPSWPNHNGPAVHKTEDGMFLLM